MGFSPLANMKRRIPDGGRSDARNSRITGFTIHHNAGVNAYKTASSPGRVVSANYWITNEGDIIPNVDENRRAWTTGAAGYPAGAASDHRNITVEVSNSPAGVRNGSWAISAKAKTALEKLIGDVFRRHRLGRVHRGTRSGVAIHRDFVPTECPGGYIVSHLSSIIANAEKYRTGKSTPQKGKVEVVPYHRKDKHSSIGRGRTLRPGDHIYLNERNGVASQATNVVGGVGQYSITTHVYAVGEPGDSLELTLFWKNTKKKGSPLSGHYVERIPFDKNGKIYASREFKRPVSSGYAVYLMARNPKDSSKNCSVRLLSTDAYLFKA